MIYGISDKPKAIKEWLLYSFQMMLSVVVATVLIAQICGTPADAAMFGGFIGTVIYASITKFKSPMFISSCGATVSAVCGALAVGDGNNYTAVVIGGAMIAIIYIVMGLIVDWKGIDFFNSLFPPTIVGAVTIVIGLNLATFIPTYVQVGAQQSNWGVIIAIITMLVVAVASHYFKGFAKTIPFLIAIAVGYVLSTILTLTGAAPVIDFTSFKNTGLLHMPDFAFFHLNNTITWKDVGTVALKFVPVGLVALLEHYSDHRVLSNIVGTDLTVEPGLRRTLWGDGIASFIGTVMCGLPNTSYGESIATIGYSKVASVWVTLGGALMLGLLAFISPVQNFINSIPSCVFGGCAMILYGYIASSGLKTLLNNKVDLENQKNLVIVCVVLTVGVSGICLFTEAFSGVGLAMVLGLILNFILKEKKVD